MADTKISALTAATDLSNMVLAGEALGVNKSYATSLFDARYAQLSGATFTGKLNTVASAAGGAGFNLPAGAAPTTPTNGDMWTTTVALFYRINGTTFQSATLAGTETLTGKTMDGGSNTFTNISLTSSITGTLGVTHGGTGLASFASGDMIYASAANTLSALAKGTANQVLTMNGAGTFPIWATAANTTGVLVTVSAFTVSGTWTPNAATTKAFAIVTGGGGAGSGVTSLSTDSSGGGGGGAGGTTLAFISSPSTLTVTIGAGGTAGSGAGGNGGTTSLGTITANGGSGAAAAGSTSGGPGGAGAAATATGTVSSEGGDGGAGTAYTSSATVTISSGIGGSSFWGSGGASLRIAGAGNAGGAFGSGGSGGLSVGTAGQNGGAGAPGVVVILEFK